MRSRSTAAPILFGALLLLAWEAVVRICAIPSYLLPPPTIVAGRFAEAWGDGTMLRHVLPTATELTLGGLLGGAVGLGLGVLLGLSGAARRIASPYLVAAQSTPLLALGPLFALWFGPGPVAKVVICAVIALFPIAVATLVAVRDTPPELIEMARSLGASPRQVLLQVRLPAARAGIFGGARVAATLAVVGAVVGEWLGAGAGLGVLVNLARGSLFDTPLLFAALLQIALLGLAAYGFVVLAERLSSGTQR